jgi:hypothetical protein
LARRQPAVDRVRLADVDREELRDLSMASLEIGQPTG